MKHASPLHRPQPTAVSDGLSPDRLKQHGIPVKIQELLLAAGKSPTFTIFSVSMPMRWSDGR